MKKFITLLQRASIKTKFTAAILSVVALLFVAQFWALFSSFDAAISQNIFRRQFVLISEIAEQINGRIEPDRHQFSLAAIGVDRALTAFAGSMEQVNSQGERMLGSFRKISDTKRIPGADVPYHEAFKHMTQFRERAWAISFLGILASLGLAWLTTHYLTRPIMASASPSNETFTPANELLTLRTAGDDRNEPPAEKNDAHLEEARVSDQVLTEEKEFFSAIIQNTAAPMFVIDRNHTILFWNNALAKLTGKSSFQMKNTKQQWTPFYSSKRPVLADLVVDHNLRQMDEFYSDFQASKFIEGAFQAEGWFDNIGGERRYLFFEASPIINSRGEIVAAVETLKDITERKLAQEATSNHNLLLQGILDAIPNPVFYKNINGAYISCNKSFQQFFGCRLQELVDKSVDDVMHDRYLKETILHDTEVLIKKSCFTSEEILKRHDGADRNVVITKAPFFNSSGELAGIVGVFVDVTDQRKMDDQLRRMHRAIEQSPASIVITDINGIIEYVNPRFCKTTGYTSEEAIGQNPSILKSGEISRESYAELWESISSGKEWRGELHNKRKDGSLYWEFASISPLNDKDDVTTGYLAVKEDITERKAVEAELALNRKKLEEKHLELEQLFKQVEYGKREWEVTLDHLRDYIILADSEQHIRRCNKLLVKDTGKSFSEIIGLNWMDLIGEAGFKFVRYNGKTGEIYNSRSLKSFDITVYPISIETVFSGYVVSINDTTELRAASQELEKTYSELKEAQLHIFQQEKMASIGQLAAGVAHEINNPMGFISSNLSTLNKYIDRLAEFIVAGDALYADCLANGELDKLSGIRTKLKIDYVMADSRQLIAESQDGAGRVRRIVQDLKSFSRVDQAERALVNLNEALHTTINIAWNEIKYVATLNREFGDIPLVKCYPQHLNQVFLNLLVNAAHAMENHNGSITVRTWSEGENVFVSVSDNGCGIPDEIQKKIFEPFFTTKEVGKGTGLGLSISYDIIRKHGGEISVASEVGHGTTFTVCLPIAGPPTELESQS